MDRFKYTHMNRLNVFLAALGFVLLSCSLPLIGKEANNEEPIITESTPIPFQSLPANLTLIGNLTASDSADNHPVDLARDGDRETYWQAGEEQPQWIEVDLGAAVDIGTISLILYQPEEGESLHRLYGKGPLGEDEYVLLHEFSGSMVDGQVLEFTPDSPWYGIKFLKVETVQVSGEVGWREIVIYQTDEDPFGDLQVDSDNDGLPDTQDWCPETPGNPEYAGC